MAPPTDHEAGQTLHTLLHTPTPGDRAAGDDRYLRIWELEQTHTNTRWTIATFFLSVSFAIFGFSFQVGLNATLALAARLGALGIYWFAYGIFLRFNDYTRILRGYLEELERSGQTQITIQQRVRQQLGAKRLSATRLLVVLGLAYSVGVGLLWWLGL